MNKEIIYKELDRLFEDARCELNYEKDYELLLSVMLSAQTTDKRVNEITKFLFSKYADPLSLSNAKFGDVYEIIKPHGLANSKALNII